MIMTSDPRARDADRDALAADIARFRARGGRIERLGNTPIKHERRTLKKQNADRVKGLGLKAGGKT